VPITSQGIIAAPSLLVTFLIEKGKLFQSLIALYEKLLVLHKFALGVIKFKLEAPHKENIRPRM
jgi:hypothetical protein